MPAGGQSNRQPITSAGRFAHEAAAWDPTEGALYLTEDNFGFPSGFYRYLPPTDPMETGSLADGGQLQMLRVVGQPNAHLEADQANGATYAVDWVDIADPNPTFPYTPGQPAPTTNDAALSYVGNQGRAQGAAHFSRLEGATLSKGKIYFTSTQGGGPRRDRARSSSPATATAAGQIWAYDPTEQTLDVRLPVAGRRPCSSCPTTSRHSDKGTIVICEDGADRQLHPRPDEATASCSTSPSTGSAGNAPPDAPRFDEEFAGATFSPDGDTLFVNIQAAQAICVRHLGALGPHRRLADTRRGPWPRRRRLVTDCY